MKIETIKAEAFGPFSREILEFGPGMNVVHGPNESGKSSWHAAIFVGLCGMRRKKGAPTKEDQAFAARYRPWRGASWRVSARVALDTGEVVLLEHSLGPGGRSIATVAGSKTSLTAELTREGGVDGAMLVGLTRDTAAATLFVRQADVLRVLADAGELQQFLERAATTSLVDTTAEEALARIVAYKREHVGSLRGGSRGPLATAEHRATIARSAADEAQDQYERYQGQLERRHRARIELASVEAQLRDLRVHEEERHRRELWLNIYDAERRLGQAKALLQEVEGTPQDVGSRSLVTAVTKALAAYESRPAAPVEIEGPTAAELEEELRSLPDMPTGDLEPGEEVTVWFDRWRQQLQRREAHGETEPDVSSPAELPVSAGELRRLADALETPLPEVGLADDGLSNTSASSARDAGTDGVAGAGGAKVRSPLLVRGAVVAFAGVILTAALPPVGAVVVLAGLVLCAIGLLRGPSRPMGTGSSATDMMVRREARLILVQEARLQAQQKRDAASRRLAELALPVDAPSIRQLVAAAEAAITARDQVSTWESRAVEIERRLSTAAAELRAALAAHGVRMQPDEPLDKAFRRYVDTCRRRAQTAQASERRADLEARLAMRRAADAATAGDKEILGRTARQLRAVAAKTGCSASSPAELVRELRAWLDAQVELDEEQQAAAKSGARLEQLLDGRDMDELQEEIKEARASAGRELDPEALAPLDDRSKELEVLVARVRALAEQVAELSGQLDVAEHQLPDVCAAIEEEARAEAELRAIRTLEQDLDAAIDILTAAKERVHGDIAPVLNNTIRPWVGRITHGHYDDVRVDPATLEIEVHENGGQFHGAASSLSQGTAEQLFLLLRLALAKHLSATGESAPLILDDVTVQSDTERTTAVLDLLHELSRERQIVLFTQEDEVLAWATDELSQPADRLIQLPPRFSS